MKRVALLAAALLLSACGGGGDGGVTNTAPSGAQPSTTSVQINLGDDPADRLLAASVTINAMSLTSAAGGSVAVLSTPRPMEMMRLMGTVAPLATAGVPQGTYTGMTMTFGASTVTYVDPATGQSEQRIVPGPMTTTVMFGSPLVVGTNPMVVNLDMNMQATVRIDATGNVSMTPTLRAFHNPVVPGSRDPEDGGMHGLTGMVDVVGGATFTFTTTQGMPGVSMGTGSSTQYAGMTGMGMMSGGLLMSVDATMHPDGSWTASRVHARAAAGGAMASGVVTGLTGTPPTQLVLVMHDGVGSGMMAVNLAGSTTVTISDATTYSIDSRDVDLANLPFTPRFDRTSLSRGQRIEAFSAGRMVQGGGMQGMMGGGTVAATSITLGQQGLRGTVSAYAQSGAQASFTLTLPADSAFAKLTGATTVTVYQQASTRLRGLSNITNGSVVQVRGIVFPDSGTLKAVAGRILGG